MTSKTTIIENLTPLIILNIQQIQKLIYNTTHFLITVITAKQVSLQQIATLSTEREYVTDTK